MLGCSEADARSDAGAAALARRQVPSGQASPDRSSPAPRAVLVLYPIYYLMQAALDVGDPERGRRPPTARQFRGLPHYPQIMLNTLTVSFAATVMALVSAS